MKRFDLEHQGSVLDSCRANHVRGAMAIFNQSYPDVLFRSCIVDTETGEFFNPNNIK